MTNLALLQKSIIKVLHPGIEPSVAKFATAISFYARLTVMAIVVAVFIHFGWVHIPALIGGLSLGVISIFVTYLLNFNRAGAFHTE